MRLVQGEKNVCTLVHTEITRQLDEVTLGHVVHSTRVDLRIRLSSPCQLADPPKLLVGVNLLRIRGETQV